MSKPKNIGEAKPGVAGKGVPAVEAVAKSESDRVIEVVATKMGYYGNARRPAKSRFNITLAPGEKMPTWVEAVTDEAPVAPAEPSEAVSSSADVI